MNFSALALKSTGTSSLWPVFLFFNDKPIRREVWSRLDTLDLSSSCLSKFLISYPKVVPIQVMKDYYEEQSVPKNLPAITMSLVWRSKESCMRLILSLISTSCLFKFIKQS